MQELIKSELNLDSEFLAKAVIRLMKQNIFEKFTKIGDLSKEDQEFCDKINWYPIDELEVKEEYIKKLKAIEKDPHTPTTIEELDKLIGLK